MRKGPIVLGIEVGTTSTKAMVAQPGRVLYFAPSDPYYPTKRRGGYSRQKNPNVWWKAAVQAIKRALANAGVDGREVCMVAVGGQMHGLVMGRSPANLWNDSTAEPMCKVLDAVAKKSGIDLLQHTGNISGPNLTLLKLMWAREEGQDFESFTLPAGFVIEKLIGEKVIDITDASGTMMWDRKARTWSEDVMKAAGVPMDILPRLVDPLQVAGNVTPRAAAETGLKQGTPVLPGGGDQPEAAIGNGVIPSNPNRISFNIGTSGVVARAGIYLTLTPDRRLNTVAGTRGDVQYLCTMACMDAQTFAMDMLGISDPQKFDALAAMSKPGSNGVFFSPLLAGSRLLDNYVSNGGWIGAGMSTTKEDLCRAVLEAIVLEGCMGLEVMKESGLNPALVMLGGGGAKSSVLPQMAADIWRLPFAVPRITEVTVFGAIIRALVASGGYPNIETACAEMVKPARTFHPHEKQMKAYADRGTTYMFSKMLHSLTAKV